MYQVGALFGDPSSFRINAGARRAVYGWEWWVTESRWDPEMAAVVEEYLDGGVEAGPKAAAHAMQATLGAMFG